MAQTQERRHEELQHRERGGRILCPSSGRWNTEKAILMTNPEYTVESLLQAIARCKRLAFDGYSGAADWILEYAASSPKPAQREPKPSEGRVLAGPIERDDDYEREYIPLPGGWEVQTKGRGSSFRIAGPDNFRLNIPPQPYLHETLERMARDVHAAVMAATLPAGDEQMRRDAERWRAGVKFGEFPEYCHHDDTQPDGHCWYMSIDGTPYRTAEDAIDAEIARQKQERQT